MITYIVCREDEGRICFVPPMVDCSEVGVSQIELRFANVPRSHWGVSFEIRWFSFVFLPVLSGSGSDYMRI